MRQFRGLLVPLIVVSLILSSIPTSSFATPSASKARKVKCKPKREDCSQPAEQEMGTTSAASTIFNERLSIETDLSGRFKIGAFPDPITGDVTPSSWTLSYGWGVEGSTSRTTTRIDGADYTFGEQKDGTERQAPTKIDARTNQTVWQIGNDIEVTQTLQIGNNNHTRQKDTAIIAYTLRNTGTAAREVGTRVMIDTKINESDGFPFRVPGVGAITNEREFSGADVPDALLASVNPIDSTYVAAGTLKSNGATAPDRLVLADWWNFKSTDYDYTVDPTTPLTDDNVYALYWNPKALAPGETRTYVTLYGLGRAAVLTQAPLAVSLRGPARLSRVWNGYSPSTFDIVATVVNTSTATVAGVQVELNLPSELRLASGSAIQHIGDLDPGEERQASWQVHAPRRDTVVTQGYWITVEGTLTRTSLINTDGAG